MAREEEVKAAVETMERVNEEIAVLKANFDENDQEMRRQLSNATKKIAKYKEKLAEKQE